MRTTIRAAALAVLVGMAGAACTTTRAAAPVERPALDVPPPPPRVVVPLPPPPQNQLEPLPEVGSLEPMTPRLRPPREKEAPKVEPKPEEPKPAEPAPATTPPAQPPQQLRLPDSSGSPQAGQILQAINRSRQILGGVKVESLSASAQQAHKEATMFATQAREHLEKNNLPLAKELADKAERMAKALQR